MKEWKRKLGEKVIQVHYTGIRWVQFAAVQWRRKSNVL